MYKQTFKIYQIYTENFENIIKRVGIKEGYLVVSQLLKQKQ